MKATRISGEPGGPGIFAVSDGVKAWDAQAYVEEPGFMNIDVCRSDCFVMTNLDDTIEVKIQVYDRLFTESEDLRRLSAQRSESISR